MAISQWQHVQKKHIEKNTLLLLAVDFSLKKNTPGTKTPGTVVLDGFFVDHQTGRVAKFLWPAQGVVKLTSAEPGV